MALSVDGLPVHSLGRCRGDNIEPLARPTRIQSDGRQIVSIDTELPWHVESTTGETRFDVGEEQIMNSFQKLLDFLNRLEQHRIYFRLDRCRNEAIMVRVDVPGERWEIEFFVDGSTETEVFRDSDGVKSGEQSLERLFKEFSD